MTCDREIIKDLIEQLNYLTKAYNEGYPLVSDKEWDNLYFKLAEMEKETGIIYPNSPTQSICDFKDVDELKKVKHNHLMLSLNKTKDLFELEKFAKAANDYIIMMKLDGLSCSLKYIKGELVSAETRGNGIEGEDITHNMNCIYNVPKKISYNSSYDDEEEVVVVDGEIICNTKIFNANFANDYKNPRNYAAGAIRRLHASENKNSGLSFIAWDLVKGWPYAYRNYTLSDELDHLRKLGFDTTTYFTAYSSGHDYISEDIEELKNIAKKLGYPIDGIVVKYNKVKEYERLGHTEHHFRGGLAYKFYDEEYETKLVKIDYDVSRNGVLTPVAVFEPIDIEGSIVERASLHNISIMKNILGTPYAGEKLWVFKANMIIPQISKAEKKDKDKELEIVKCPVCGAPAEIQISDSGVEFLVCPNKECPGKLAQQIDHYCSKKGVDIKGLSRATIEKLVDWGWVNSISDIYLLDRYKEKWIAKPGFGTASVNKILNAINESAKNTKLVDFISALGIPLVGKTVAKTITKYFETWEDFKSAVGGDWTEFEGIGPEISKSLNNYNYEEADKIITMITLLTEIIPVYINLEKKKLEGKTFCITGKLNNYHNRDELVAEIEAQGGKVSSNVSAKTNYLITNTPDSGTAKNRDAKILNIPIITEQDFMAMIQK